MSHLIDCTITLGKLVATPGAVDYAREHGIDLRALIERHRTGDWGDLCQYDTQMNAEAVRDGSRILSVYHRPGLPESQALWVVTEADRSVTTVLLPSEY